MATTAPAAIDDWVKDGLLSSSAQQPYNVSTVTPDTWTVAPDQTVAGNVKSIIDENGPLQQQAQTMAKQDANSRGLLNTSMGVQAGQEALYKSALPMASQDASIRANAGQFNANTANQMATWNAGAKNTAAATGAGYVHDYGGQILAGEQQRETMGLGQTFDLAKMDAQTANTLRTMSADQQNNIARMALAQGYNLDTLTAQQLNQLQQMAVAQQNNLQTLGTQYGFDVSKMNVQAGIALGQMTVEQQNNLAKMAVSQGYSLETMSAQQVNQLAMAAVTQANFVTNAATEFTNAMNLLASKNINTVQLANIEAQYKQLGQASASATSIMNGLANHVNTIMLDDTLDGPAKQAALDILTSNAQLSLEIIGGLAGDVDLTAYFA